MKKSYCLTILLCLPFWLAAQTIDFNNYQIIGSQNPLPPDVTESAEKKAKKSKVKIDAGKDRKSRKAEEDFFVANNYQLDALLRSGRIIYNDPMADYVQQVFNQLIVNEERAEDVRIYIIRSRAVNAFATQDGVILITMGLLAQLTNEAQLAFVLAHEYIHYKNNHSLNEYIENLKIEKNTKGYNTRIADADQMLKKSRYSKQLEEEADKEGLALYLNTTYTLDAPNQVMDVLKYAYLPFEEISFTNDFLETPELIFPKEYHLDTLNAIDGSDVEEKDDKYSTHPNIFSRRQALNTQLASASAGDRYEFIISENDFLKIRKIARYETCRLNLLEREYETALYHAYILSQEDDQSEYVQSIAAKALYGLAIYSNHKKFKRVHLKQKETEGNLHQVVYFTEKMSAVELSLVALHYAYRIHKKFPENRDLDAIVRHLMNELVNVHKISPDKLSDLPKDTVEIIDSLSETTIDSTENTKTDKYSTIKKQGSSGNSKKKKTDITNSYIYYAFTELKKDPAFAEMWTKAGKTAPNGDEEEESEEEEGTVVSKKQKNRYKKDNFKIPLGELKRTEIPKLVFFDPFYLKFDLRKKREIKYQATAEALKKFYEKLEENAKLLNLDIEILGNKDLDEDEADKLNDVGLIYDYIDEVSTHNNMYLVSTDNTRIKALEAKYGTSYISILGAVTTVDNDAMRRIGLIVSSIAFPILIPYMIAVVAQPTYETTLLAGVYDLNKNEVIYGGTFEHYAKDNNDLVNSTLYYLMMKMKKFIIHNQNVSN